MNPTGFKLVWMDSKNRIKQCRILSDGKVYELETKGSFKAASAVHVVGDLQNGLLTSIGNIRGEVRYV